MTNHRPAKGFSLMELLIALAILGILSSIATSYYGKNVISSKRTPGRTTLLENAAKLDKCKAIYGSFNNANCSISNGDIIESPNKLYDISVVSATSTYTLTASPSTGSSQANDSECTSIILNDKGQQTGTGSDSSTCW